VAEREQDEVSTNGSTPPVDERETALSALRTTPENVHLFRGYGPLIVGIVLFVLMVTLAPTVAPEQVVERPVGGTTTTVAEAATP
jgi:hypothetical protein